MSGTAGSGSAAAAAGPEGANGACTSHEFAGSEGRIVVRTWLPAGEPTHVAVLAHGYGEHAGRYHHVAATLVAGGALVVAPDHLGHGRSDGERALVTDFEHVVDDLHRTARDAVDRAAGVPTVLMGHSLGGLIAARYAQRYGDELTALALSAPVLGTWSPAVDLLREDPIPAAPIDPETLSRDPAVGAAYVADPLVYHGPFKEQTLRAIAGTLHVVGLGRPPIDRLPTLWMHGEADTLVLPAETASGVEALGAKDLTTRIYRGARHEIFNETNKAEVLADLVAFVDVARTTPQLPAEG